MCGIAGILSLDAELRSVGKMSTMLELLHHRGPDDQRQWADASIRLGHARLKILDVSDASAQPMVHAPSGSVLAYNGELHNYRELRDHLERLGHTFTSDGDTEVVLAALAQWGQGAFAKFNGMWALAWWDARRRALLLSRDRFGIKPLYYSLRGHRFVFASEIKSIVAAFPEERQADLDEIHAYLHGASPDVRDHTFFANVRSLLPAHSVTIDSLGQPRLKRYWSIEPSQSWCAGSEQTVAEFRQLLMDSVDLRLRSDVPVGIALSGGLDSSSIATIAAARGHDVQAYSLRYPGRRIDESRFAEEVARRIGCRLVWVEPSGDNVVQRLQSIVWQHDAPTPLRGRLPNWSIMERAGQDVRVFLDGTGADELLAGYGFFLNAYWRDRFERLWRDGDRPRPGAILEDWRQLTEVTGRSRNLVAVWLGDAMRTRLRRLMHNGFEAADFRRARGPIDPNRRRAKFAPRSMQHLFQDHLRNALWFDFSCAGLPESLHDVDAASMTFSVETRSPFLDHRLVEMGFALAPEHRISNGWTKQILRRAMIDDLPQRVVQRRLKVGFPAPYADWLSAPGPQAMIRQTLDSRRCFERGVLNEAWLRRVFGKPERARKFTTRYVDVVWRMTSLEVWFRQFIDGDGESVVSH